MQDDDRTDFRRMPGLYRMWDLQFVLSSGAAFQIHFAELTDDGTPLFAVYSRSETRAAKCPGERS